MSEIKPLVLCIVNLDSIVYDEQLQVRNEIDKGTVERYASAYLSGNKLPPIKVARVEKTLMLVDGWHRVAALRSISRGTVEAEIVECESRKEIHWIAAQANLRHGFPLKSSEIRNVFKAYMKAEKYKDHKDRLKSYREITRELGGLRAYTTIRQWIRQDFPKLAAQFSEGEGKSNGGTKDAEGMDKFEVIAAEALSSALAAFKGIKDTETRGKLIGRAEEVIRMMKNEGEPGLVEEDFLHNMRQ